MKSIGEHSVSAKKCEQNNIMQTNWMSVTKIVFSAL